MPYPGYAGWIVVLDDPLVASNRTALDINNPASGIQIGGSSSGQGPDWGVAQFTQFMAQQSKYGSAAADWIFPNRTVTIPLLLGNPLAGVTPNAALESLREKVGLFQREGGWLRRQRSGGSNLYADVVDAQLTVPDTWAETGQFQDGVSLVLITLPDWYGDEITLDVASSTGVYEGVLTASGAQAAIEGDHPARARIIVTDASGNNQLAAAWGIRSRYYDSAPTAALFYEAEALTPVNGAAVTALSGASGGDAVTISSLPAGSWVSFLTSEIASGSEQMTHQGSYRVWARCYSSTGTPEFQLLWGVGSLSVPVTNTPVTLPGASAFYLLDLGEVRIDYPPVGTPQWFWAVQAYSAVGADSASVDCVYLQPLDDGAGQLTYVNEPPASFPSATAGAGTGADNSGIGTVAWTSPGDITAQDGAYASVSLSAGATSHYLEATNFGFAIPASATIEGIEATLYRYGSWTKDGSVVHDAAVRLIKAGVVQSTDRSSTGHWSSSPGDASYGGSNDLWGGTWTPTDINNSGFGFAISAAASPLEAGSGSIDFVSITVYYTLDVAFSIATDAVVYADQPCEIRYDQHVRGAPPPEAGVYGPVSQVVGDLARIPPSGMENRPVQLFIKPSRGDLNALPDAGLDSFTVQAVYRPCWLFRP